MRCYCTRLTMAKSAGDEFVARVERNAQPGTSVSEGRTRVTLALHPGYDDCPDFGGYFRTISVNG